MKELPTSYHYLELEIKLKIKYPELTVTDLEYQELHYNIIAAYGKL